MVNIDELISEESFEEFLKKESGKPKKTPQEIEQNLFGGNKDLKAITEQVEEARAMITRKKLREVSQDVVGEDSIDNVDNVENTVEYTQEELFLGLDKEEKLEEEEIEDENPEDKLIVYPEPEDGVDTDSEMIMRNSFHTQSGGFYLITTEYERAKRSLQLIWNSIFPDKIKILEWDSMDGMPEIDEQDIDLDEETKKSKLFATLNKILYFIDNYEGDNKYIFVIKDLSFFANGNYKGKIMQALQKINEKLRETDHQLIITDMYEKNIPEYLAKITKVKFDLPTEVDLNRMILEIFHKLPKQQQKQLTKKNIIKIIEMLLGIEYEEARIKLLSIFHQYDNIDQDFFMELSAYKKDMINRHKALEYHEAYEGFTWDNYIGRSVFKSSIEQLKIQVDYREEFENIKKSKSVLLLWQPGTGKSYAAACTAQYLGKPVIRVDLGRLLGKYSWDAEQSFSEMRKIFLAIKDQAVFWIDEFEKMFPSGDRNTSKSSVESRLEGSMLWLFQELKHYWTIMILTSNEPWRLSAPTLRAQRIDEMFYFDFPNKWEREELFKFFLAKHKINYLDDETIQQLVQETEHFSESEIENFVDKIVSKFKTNRIMLSIKKAKFVYLLTFLDKAIDLAKKLINDNYNMEEFVKDLHNMNYKKLVIKYDCQPVENIKGILELMKYISSQLLDKNSLIVQSDIKFAMLSEYLAENKILSLEKGNITDVIRGMKKDLNIRWYLSSIIDTLIKSIFNNNKRFCTLKELKKKDFVLDNSENRNLLLLLIVSIIDSDMDASMRNYVYKQMKVLYSNRESLMFQEFLEEIHNIFNDKTMFSDADIYDKIFEVTDTYSNKVIFPELTWKDFLNKVGTAKNGITYNKNREDCERIEKWGQQYAYNASSKDIKEDEKDKISVDIDFFEKMES